MKKLVLIMMLLLLFAVPVDAVEIEPVEPPDSALDRMPETSGNFGQDLWYVIRSAVFTLRPDLAEGFGVCLRVFSVAALMALLKSYDGAGKSAVELAGVVSISCILLQSAGSMIRLGVDTVQEISRYGTLLLPVMAAGLAAQGGTASSAALYAGTAVFDTLLTNAISKVLVPMVFIFLVLGILNAATGENQIKRLQDIVKWLMVWFLKILMYLFTGFISISGVVSGSADQAALKATKLTISGAVPVVGSILSDASEAILVSVGLAKNAAGVYGILAVIAIFIGPFLTLAVQSAMLKFTAVICGVVSDERSTQVIECFSGAMRFLLGMTGAACLLQLISTVCFMKGMG